jgi:hypothetical protein
MTVYVRALTVVSCLALLQPMLVAQDNPQSATLSVTSAVPPTDGVNFSVGAPVMLMRGSFREALRKRGTSLADWTAACRAAELLCPQGLEAAEPLVVHVKALDDHGRASFDGVTPGRYYLFGLGVAPSGPVVWDLKIDLRPGDNTLQLDERNVAALTTASASARRPMDEAHSRVARRE